MADQKISELVAATSAAGADLLNIVQGGSNKKLTVANLFANLDTPVIINESGGDQDTRVEGLNDNNLLYVDASTDRVGVGVATPTQKLDGYRDSLKKKEEILIQLNQGVVNTQAEMNMLTGAIQALEDIVKFQTEEPKKSNDKKTDRK